MKNLYVTGRRSAITRIVMFALVVLVVSCEELAENLTPRDNIVDTWKCLETQVGNGSESFLVEIEADPQALSGVRIYNFNHLGDNFAIKATVSSSSISIPSQVVDGFTISGNGSIDGDYEEINLTYSVNDGGGRENYTAVLTKP